MPEGTFSGTSENGDFHEALNIAVQNAKEGLETDYITWDQLRLYGENGGYIPGNRLTVEVYAKSPA